MIPHASPSINNARVAAGWIEGMGANYKCDPGYDGSASALCGEDGNFTVSGSCEVAPSVEFARLYRNIHGLSWGLGLENAAIIAFIAVFCWKTRCSASARVASDVESRINNEMYGGRVTPPLTPYILNETPRGEGRDCLECSLELTLLLQVVEQVELTSNLLPALIQNLSEFVSFAGEYLFNESFRVQ